MVDTKGPKISSSVSPPLSLFCVPVATDNSNDNKHIYNTVQWVSIKDKCIEYKEQAHDTYTVCTHC